MKLTPLDIHHKEFRHAVRGYSEEEVDAFLDEVAEEFERLFKENLDLAEQLRGLTERLHVYQQMESTINNTLFTAQRSADETVAKASLEAEAIRREAEGKATEIVHEALQGKQEAVAELSKLRQAQAKFREDYRRLLVAQLDALGGNEVTISADAEQVAGDVAKAAEVAPQTLAFVAPTRAPQPVFVPAAPQGAPMAPVTEPEAAQPELMVEHVELTDPEEFEIPSLASLGEREDDIDIEEID